MKITTQDDWFEKKEQEKQELENKSKQELIEMVSQRLKEFSEQKQRVFENLKEQKFNGDDCVSAEMLEKAYEDKQEAENKLEEFQEMKDEVSKEELVTGIFGYRGKVGQLLV